jgi:hypothetical protein
MTAAKRRFAEALHAGCETNVEAVRMTGRKGSPGALRECARRWRNDPGVVAYLEQLAGRAAPPVVEPDPAALAVTQVTIGPQIARSLEQLAFTSLVDLYKPDAYGGIELDLAGALESGALAAVRSLTVKPDGTVEIKLYDRQRALRDLVILTRPHTLPRPGKPRAVPQVEAGPDAEPPAGDPAARREAARARRIAERQNGG